MDNKFKFYIPLNKAQTMTIGNDSLVGVASTLSLDRDEERMSDRALKMMVSDIKVMGINLFGNHEHNWENTLGAIKDAELREDKVMINVTLDDPVTNQKIPMLLNKLKKGIKLGLSVGGTVTDEKWEYNSELGKKVKVIDGVKLYEISVVGIPSNTESFVSLPTAISKSRKFAKDENLVAYCSICKKRTTWTKTDGHSTCDECGKAEQIMFRSKCPISKSRKFSKAKECVNCGKPIVTAWHDPNNQPELSFCSEKCMNHYFGKCPICFGIMKAQTCQACFYKLTTKAFPRKVRAGGETVTCPKCGKETFSVIEDRQGMYGKCSSCGYSDQVAQEEYREEKIVPKKPKCDSCEMMVINNIPTHEQGCPNAKKSVIVKARAEGVGRMTCSECQRAINSCDNCGKYFNERDIVECERGKLHYCSRCYGQVSGKSAHTCPVCYYKSINISMEN
jgi:HK97 family phage prohead protease